MKTSLLDKVPSENLTDFLIAASAWIYGAYLTFLLFGKDFFTILWVNIIFGIFFAFCDVIFIYMMLFHWSKIQPEDKWNFVTLSLINIVFIIEKVIWLQ
jgi:hypothetical protein